MYLHPGYELNALDSWLVWMHHKCRDVGSRNLTKASQLTIPVITAVNNSRSSTYAKICSCPWTKSELWSDNVQTIFYFLFAVRMNKNFLWVNLNFFCDVGPQLFVWPRWCEHVLSREKTINFAALQLFFLTLTAPKFNQIFCCCHCFWNLCQVQVFFRLAELLQLVAGPHRHPFKCIL